MKRISLRDAESCIRALVAYLKTGEEIILTEDGRPVARLLPPEDPSEAPTIGANGSSGRERSPEFAQNRARHRLHGGILGRTRT